MPVYELRTLGDRRVIVGREQRMALTQAAQLQLRRKTILRSLKGHVFSIGAEREEVVAVRQRHRGGKRDGVAPALEPQVVARNHNLSHCCGIG